MSVGYEPSIPLAVPQTDAIVKALCHGLSCSGGSGIGCRFGRLLHLQLVLQRLPSVLKMAADYGIDIVVVVFGNQVH